MSNGPKLGKLATYPLQCGAPKASHRERKLKKLAHKWVASL